MLKCFSLGSPVRSSQVSRALRHGQLFRNWPSRRSDYWPSQASVDITSPSDACHDSLVIDVRRAGHLCLRLDDSWRNSVFHAGRERPIPAQRESVSANHFEENAMPIAKLVVEFIGTFFLVFTVGMTVKSPDAAGPGPAGHRLGPDGHGLRGRPFLGRPLQPGRDPGRDSSGQVHLGRRHPLHGWPSSSPPSWRLAAFCSSRGRRAGGCACRPGPCDIQLRRPGSWASSSSRSPWFTWS